MRYLLLLFATVFVVSCAASGIQVQEKDVRSFERGKTTYNDVLNRLGRPTSVMVNADGSRWAIYSYAQVQTRPETFIPFVGAFVGGADVKSNFATFMFDRAEVLVDYRVGATETGTGMGAAAGAPYERVPDQPRKTE